MDARPEIPDIAGLTVRFEHHHRRDGFYIGFLKAVLTEKPNLVGDIRAGQITSIQKGKEACFIPLAENVLVSNHGTVCVVFDAYYSDGTGSILVAEVGQRTGKPRKKKTDG